MGLLRLWLRILLIEIVGRGTADEEIDVCSAAFARGVVRLPSVRKGMASARMRMIQEMVAASALGLAVRLPRSLASRRGCHYDANCYLDYHEASGSIWNVYHRESTLLKLREAGVCVLESEGNGIDGEEEYDDDDLGGLVAPVQWPLAYSQLTKRPETQEWLQRLSHHPPESNQVALADSRYCCALLIPDSLFAVDRISKVTNALIASERTRDHARRILRALGLRQQNLNKEESLCAVHWRDNDDLVAEFNLDRRDYAKSMAKTVASVSHQCGGALLVLGDVPARRLDIIQQALNDQGNQQPVVRLYTKASLVDPRRLNLASEYGDFDDLEAVLDLELATTADIFIGTPFSALSVLAAVSRSESSPHTIPAIMTATVKFDDNRAHIFDILFPYRNTTIKQDPCASLSALSPKFAKRLARGTTSCPFGGEEETTVPAVSILSSSSLSSQKTIDAMNMLATNSQLKHIMSPDLETTQAHIHKIEAVQSIKASPACDGAILLDKFAALLTTLSTRLLLIAGVFFVFVRPRRNTSYFPLALAIMCLVVTLVFLCLDHQRCDLVVNTSLSAPVLPSRATPGIMATDSTTTLSTLLRNKDITPHSATATRSEKFTDTISSRINHHQEVLASSTLSFHSNILKTEKNNKQASIKETKPLRVAVVSSNFGTSDLLNTAPRQQLDYNTGIQEEIRFFLFTRNRDFLAPLRGWTQVLPMRLGPTSESRRLTSAAEDMTQTKSAVVYSRSWENALRLIDSGRKFQLTREAYPPSSRQLVGLPFDLASLEHTRRHEFGNKEHADAQVLVDVMGPKFVKLQMFKIDILKPYDILIWADASLVLDTFTVNRALKPLLRSQETDLAVQPHPKRNSTFAEIKHILTNRSQKRFIPIEPYLRDQLAFYTQSRDFHDDGGLYWMAFFAARRSNNTVSFFDRWWLEVRRWQYRDQVSVMYALNSQPSHLRPRVVTFDANNNTNGKCCRSQGKKYPPEQVLCLTLVGDLRKCCRRCYHRVPVSASHHHLDPFAPVARQRPSHRYHPFWV